MITTPFKSQTIRDGGGLLPTTARSTLRPPTPPSPHPYAGDIECLAEAARSSSLGIGGLNAYDDEGQTALHIAADQGHAEAVAILGTAGADVNAAREEDGRTPL